jgi:HAD superfamily hydrolase (TIGR01450 family)
VTPAELLPDETRGDPGLTAEPYLKDRLSQSPSVVLVGIDTAMTYSSLGLACRLIEDDATFIATNRDFSFPVEEGYFIPGNGAFVDLLERVTGRHPTNLGKPEPHLVELIEEEKGVSREHMVMVGDRLDTDIAFALRSGMRSVLMLTGIAGDPERRGIDGAAEVEPTFTVADFPDFIVRFDVMFPQAS